MKHFYLLTTFCLGVAVHALSSCDDSFQPIEEGQYVPGTPRGEPGASFTDATVEIVRDPQDQFIVEYTSGDGFRYRVTYDKVPPE